MAFVPGTHIGPYRLIALIGKGGMGEVYRARDPKLGRDVAIKVLPAGFAEDMDRLRRFEQEARAASALNHPNILTIYELGTHEGAPYMVMELLEGQTLREAMGSSPMAAERVAELGEQIAAGLAAAHERGIVHRDLKPENLFITRDGVVKILDFGLAKRSQLDSLDSTAAMGVATASGTVMGTLSYMSPEQATGKPVAFPSDQFSFGVVLYELLSGKRPFAGESAAETLAAIVRDDPAPLAELSPGMPRTLAAIVQRCLAKEPKDRFASTRELARNLSVARLHAHSGGTAATGLQPYKVSARLKDRRILAGGILAIALGVAGVLLWQLWKPAPKPDRMPSVLALPSKVLGSADSAFLTDAIPESISTLLMRVDGLDTKLPPSSLQVEKVQGDFVKIADAYKAKNLVRTTVTAQGENLVLNVQLVEATAQKVRWAGQFEGTRTTYNQMAKQAAEALVRVLRPDHTAAVAAGYLESSEVELALQESRFHKRQFDANNNAESFARARTALERALRLAPGSSRVASDMAWLLWSKVNWGGNPSTEQEMEAWARKALQADPRNGSAWAALASSRRVASLADLDESFGWAVKGLRLAPRDPGTNSSIGGDSTLVSVMVACGLRAVELDPLSGGDAGMSAAGLVWLGRPAEALALTERSLALFPEDTFVQSAKAFALCRLGRLQEARALLDRCRPASVKPISFHEDYWNEVNFALAATEGDGATARKLAAQQMAHHLVPAVTWWDLCNGATTMSPGLMRLGLREEVLQLFERAAKLGTAPGLDWLEGTPELQPLRSDPRFAKIRASARAAAAIQAKHLEEAKVAGELPRYLDQPLAELQALLRRTP